MSLTDSPKYSARSIANSARVDKQWYELSTNRSTVGWDLLAIQERTFLEAGNSPSPFHRLPTEITVEIFKQSIPTPLLHFAVTVWVWRSLRSSFARKEAPLLLGWVCRRWRNIHHTSPQLWTTLEIWGRHESDRDTTMIKDWLQRSAQLPLTLVYAEDDKALIDGDIEMLKSVSHRIRDVTFNLFPKPTSQLAPLRGCFKVLQSLTIMTAYLPDGNFCDAFQDAPLLCRARVAVARSLLRVKLLWEQLTEFVCFPSCEWPIDEYITLLRNCPNLDSFTVSVMRHSYSTPSIDLLVTTHHQLRVLRTIHCEVLVHFFEITSFPSLRELHFSGSIKKSGGVKAFKELSSVFWDSIERVYIGNPSISRQIPSLLQLMPSLAEIGIELPLDGLSLLLNSFVPTAKRPLLAPSLHTLTIGTTPTERIQDSDRTALIRMLRNRCLGAAGVDTTSTGSIKIVKVKGSGAYRLVDIVRVRKEGLGDYIECIDREL